jgi:hypothetical protein
MEFRHVTKDIIQWAYLEVEPIRLGHSLDNLERVVLQRPAQLVSNQLRFQLAVGVLVVVAGQPKVAAAQIRHQARVHVSDNQHQI